MSCLVKEGPGLKPHSVDPFFVGLKPHANPKRNGEDSQELLEGVGGLFGLFFEDPVAGVFEDDDGYVGGD